MSIETAARAQAVALLRDAELDAYADELEDGFADAAAVIAERERVLLRIEQYLARFDGEIPIGVSSYGVPLDAIRGYCAALREEGT